MTEHFFRDQMKMIVEDFGPKEYTPLRMRDIWLLCKDLTEDQFAKIVTHFRRTRMLKYPPLPTHFEEEAYRQRQTKFNREVKDTAQNMSIKKGTPEEMRAHMKDVLLGEFGAVDNLSDALEIARLRMKLNG